MSTSTISLVRRRLLAAAAALAASGKWALAVDNSHRAGPLNPQTPAAVGESRLYLPNATGGAVRMKFAPSPAWARDTPGWYVPDTTSAGVGIFDFATRPADRIAIKLKSFRELPVLLAEARSLGTDTIYLVDWYEGLPGARKIDYWEAKGDYVPRRDLGGEAAFNEGIAALHAQGGRMIVYVEGFIINERTEAGREHGAQWSILRPDGPPREPYPGNWKLCPAAAGFVSYMEGLGQRIAQYGADGVFVDSYGYQKDWECVSKAHGHPLGSKEVFNNGAAHLMQRVRAGLHSANPDAIILIEGPLLERLFEFVDGSLDAGIHALVTQWLWDAQGSTDTITSSWSIDDWHQVLAIGAKLACPPWFLEAPPHGSATGVLDELMKRETPSNARDLHRVAFEALRNLHQWRNAGLIAGLRMPALNEFAAWSLISPTRDPLYESIKDPASLTAVLQGLRPRAAAIDMELAGRPAAAPTAYIKTLLTARREIAKVIDHGGTVTAVNAGFPRVAAWRFAGTNGVALTAVNVADIPHRIVFPNAPGTWLDGVKGEMFTAQGNALAVAIPPHGIRLMHAM
jgi:hypothetical protein